MLAIAIIEGQPMIRANYSAYLRVQPEFRVVAVVASVEELLLEMTGGTESPQVILSNISLPGMTGIEGIKSIKEVVPKAEVLLISACKDSTTVFEALWAGAAGYLIKSTPLNLLKEHLLQVAEGDSPISPCIARHVVEYFRPVRIADEVLTSRELQLVQGIEIGLSYKLIADRLSISPQTVNSHIRNIYRKLKVKNKSELLMRRKGQHT